MEIKEAEVEANVTEEKDSSGTVEVEVKEWEEPLQLLRDSLNALEEKTKAFDLFEKRLANLESFYKDQIDTTVTDSSDGTEVTIDDVFVKEDK